MTSATESTTAGAATDGPAWDPLVRLTHWGIAAAVLANGLLLEGGSLVHIWIGYGVVGLLSLRLLWGFIGPVEARFSAFPPTVSGAISHLRSLFSGQHKTYRSHNPAGALMVYAFWAVLSVTAATGITMAWEPLPAGSEAVSIFEGREEIEHRGHVEEGEHGEGDEIIAEIHDIAANLLLILAALHVGGVALDSALTGRKLVSAMIRGKSTTGSTG